MHVGAGCRHNEVTANDKVRRSFRHSVYETYCNTAR